jgi:Fe-S-cluster-containing hydrogenase component 2
MVDHIKRDKNDIYGWPVLGFMFKNPTFLLVLKLLVFWLFLYAIAYGFIDQSSENIFTSAIFWGIFWPFFMVITLGTLGRVFCGICPHGFMGKYLTKWGLKKKMPKPLQNPMIGVLLLVIGWWAVYYAFPGFFKTPYATAMLFLVMTAVASLFYFLYSDMAYCKSVCPIGAVSRGFSKVSFTWLGTYKQECDSCKTFDCATACPHNLKPFTFDSRNSMTDCTLCMDCSTACEAVSFKVKKPSFSLFSKFQNHKAEVWALILIAASITITMNFHHALGRSAIVESFPWTQTARYFEGIFDFGMADSVGIFAFLYALGATLFLVYAGMFIAAKIMKTPFSQTFYTLGYAIAPIFIIGGLSHLLETFFLRTASDITNGFIQGFSLPLEHMEPLATRKDKWIYMFGMFNYIAAIWALVILYGRIKLLESKKLLKAIAYPFAGAFIIFYLGLNLYKVYVFKTYGMQRGGHNHHSAHVQKQHQPGQAAQACHNETKAE